MLIELCLYLHLQLCLRFPWLISCSNISFCNTEERRKNVLGIFGGGSKSVDGRAASEAEHGHANSGARGASMSSVGGHGRVTEEKVSCFNFVAHWLFCWLGVASPFPAH